MRTYGKVSPKLWTGNLGRSLRGNAMAQALAVYLVSGPHANMIGLYRLPLAYAALDLGHSEAAMLKAMAVLEKARYCVYDADTERVWVVEHLRHELGGERLKGGDKRLKGIQRELDENAVSKLAAQLAAHYLIDWDSCPLQAPSESLRSQEQEQEHEQEQAQEHVYSPEPPAASEPPVMTFPTVGESAEWVLTRGHVANLRESYPTLDVLAECRKALGWVRADERRRKTPRGMPKFLFGWMGRTQDRGGGARSAPSPPKSNDEIAAEVEERLKRNGYLS